MTERKTALITGASRGIGRATAVEFARRGYRLVLNYRSAEEEARLLERELREGYGTQVLLCRADVADDEEVRGMAEAGRRAFGPMDVLVCNAGIAAQRPRDVVHHGLRKTTVDAQAVHDHRAVQQLDDLLGRKPEALVRIAGTLQLSAGFQQHFHAIRTARGALGLTLHADGQR